MELCLIEQNNHRLNLQENFRRAMLLGDGVTGVLLEVPGKKHFQSCY